MNIKKLITQFANKPVEGIIVDNKLQIAIMKEKSLMPWDERRISLIEGERNMIAYLIMLDELATQGEK